MSTPAVYLRKSKKVDESKAAQMAAVMELVRRDGHDGDAVVYDDWGRSGDRAKLAKRTAWREMNEAIERGDISSVYVRVLDRTGRSLEEWLRFLRTCKERGVRIIDQTGERTDPDREDVALFEMWHAEKELKRAQERAAFRGRMQAERGDRLGRPAYGWRVDREPETGRVMHVPEPSEDPSAVLDAYERAGSFLGAAKLLTTEGKVNPRHGDHWSEQTVQRVVRRQRTVGKIDQGVKQHADWTLFRLIRCPHDGKTLTAQHREHPIYFCNAARRDPRHPRPYAVAESKVIEWVKAEASRFHPPETVVIATAHEERRAALLAKREGIGWSVANGLITDREAALAAVGEVDAELASLEDRERAVDVPLIDWDRWEPKAINEVLRALWEHVQLDAAMRPIEVAWRVPTEYIA